MEEEGREEDVMEEGGEKVKERIGLDVGVGRDVKIACEICRKRSLECELVKCG